jgi:hypothetical protein
VESPREEQIADPGLDRECLSKPQSSLVKGELGVNPRLSWAFADEQPSSSQGETFAKAWDCRQFGARRCFEMAPPRSLQVMSMIQ